MCEHVCARMKERGVRADMAQEGIRLGKAIRNAEVAKVPVMAVVGDQEIESGSLAVRTYGGNDLGTVDVDTLIERMVGMIERRSEAVQFTDDDDDDDQ